jgi:hypothetical protein
LFQTECGSNAMRSFDGDDAAADEEADGTAVSS